MKLLIEKREGKTVYKTSSREFQYLLGDKRISNSGYAKVTLIK